MKKQRKLHEAIAIVNNAESTMFIRFSALNLSQKNIKRLQPLGKAISTAFKNMENELNSMLEEQKAEDNE
jgi:hypothetical protein